MRRDEYDKKIDEFITTNNFTKLTKDQTKQQQQAIRKPSTHAIPL
jgi:hypothetical protein